MSPPLTLRVPAPAASTFPRRLLPASSGASVGYQVADLLTERWPEQRAGINTEKFRALMDHAHVSEMERRREEAGRFRDAGEGV